MFLTYRMQENHGGIIYTQVLENITFQLPKYWNSIYPSIRNICVAARSPVTRQMSRTEDKKKLAVLQNVSLRMSNPSPQNFVLFSLTITALDQAWEQLCIILNKQLGISSCQQAPFGALQKPENTVPLLPHPVYRYSPKTAVLTLRFFTKEMLENPVRATRAPS